VIGCPRVSPDCEATLVTLKRALLLAAFLAALATSAHATEDFCAVVLKTPDGSSRNTHYTSIFFGDLIQSFLVNPSGGDEPLDVEVWLPLSIGFDLAGIAHVAGGKNCLACRSTSIKGTVIDFIPTGIAPLLLLN
jgi:hypothetical protein